MILTFNDMFVLATEYLGRNNNSMMQIITNEINHSNIKFKVLENATG